jgi:hypothetical protein
VALRQMIFLKKLERHQCGTSRQLLERH